MITVEAMSKYQWKTFVNEKINKRAFETLVYQCQNNAKIKYLKYGKFSQQSHFRYLGLLLPVLFSEQGRECSI